MLPRARLGLLLLFRNFPRLSLSSSHNGECCRVTRAKDWPPLVQPSPLWTLLACAALLPPSLQPGVPEPAGPDGLSLAAFCGAFCSLLAASRAAFLARQRLRIKPCLITMLDALFRAFLDLLGLSTQLQQRLRHVTLDRHEHQQGCCELARCVSHLPQDLEQGFIQQGTAT